MSNSDRGRRGRKWPLARDDLVPTTPIRERLYHIIFEAETPAGKAFDIVLIVSILLSVLAVMLDSVSSYRAAYGGWFYAAEWFFTILFTIEYVLRLATIRKPHVYAFSFYGIVDLLAILPTYLSLLLPGTQYLLTIRILRVLRVFRVLKIVQYMGDSDLLARALWNSRRKILIFMFTVLLLTVIIGSLIYVIEGEEHGYDNIFVSIYWTIVTITTVGYGDIAPQTAAGKTLASIAMIVGYGIIAVPTGIVTVELSQALRAEPAKRCQKCGLKGHDADAAYCRKCGSAL